MNPMRVLLKVQKSPPPTLDRPKAWSRAFNDFLARCLVKDPQGRILVGETLKVMSSQLPLLSPKE